MPQQSTCFKTGQWIPVSEEKLDDFIFQKNGYCCAGVSELQFLNAALPER